MYYYYYYILITIIIIFYYYYYYYYYPSLVFRNIINSSISTIISQLTGNLFEVIPALHVQNDSSVGQSFCVETHVNTV